MGKVVDLTNQTFGKLTVIKRYEKNNKQGLAQWICSCSCDPLKTIVVVGSNLIRGNTKSCGCFAKEKLVKRSKKYNRYDLTGEFGIGFTSNKNQEFYFDKEDFNKIKDYCWSSNKQDHIYSTTSKDEYGKTYQVFLHRLILGLPISAEKDIYGGHKNGNPFDNRKQNLDIVDHQQNMLNLRIYKNNKSGVRGVSEYNNCWISKMYYKKELVLCKIFKNFEDAVIARLKAEKQYFGEFAPQKHLFKQYGIEE